MWVERRDERVLAGKWKSKKKEPFTLPSVLHPSLASQHYLCLENVPQIYEATQQASCLFQYTVKIIKTDTSNLE